jgi:hypothetical protein
MRVSFLYFPSSSFSSEVKNIGSFDVYKQQLRFESSLVLDI